MKKILFVFLFATLLFAGANASVKADTCGLQDDGSVVSCGNGPIVPMPAGWVHYAPGVGGCPAWFAWGYKQGCMGPAGL